MNRLQHRDTQKLRQMVMTAFKNACGATFQENAAVNPRLINDVVYYFASHPDSERCKQDLMEIFKKWQYSKISQKKKEIMTPLSTLTKLSSIPRKHEAILRPNQQPSTSSSVARSATKCIMNNELAAPPRAQSKIVAPRITVSKMRTAFRPDPKAPAKPVKSRTRINANAPVVVELGGSSPITEPFENIATTSTPPMSRPRSLPTVEPFIFIEGLPIPKDIIERDILYVASQLVGRNQEDLPMSMNSLTRVVMNVAKHFKLQRFTKKVALRTIGHIFWKLDCVPIEFLNTFTFHPNNPFFQDLEFRDPIVNHAIRTSALYSRRLSPCELDKSFGSRQQISSQVIVEDFLNSFNDNVDDLADSIELMTHKSYKSKDLRELLGEVTIISTEMAMGRSSLLAVPGEIGVVRSSILTTDERREYMKDRIIPRADIAVKLIQEDINQLEERLKIQFGEGAAARLNKSLIMEQCLQYVLQPTALIRQNFWQARGSDLPNWFPGFYTVFHDSYKLRPTLQPSPSATFLNAWRSLAPVIDSN